MRKWRVCGVYFLNALHIAIIPLITLTAKVVRISKRFIHVGEKVSVDEGVIKFATWAAMCFWIWSISVRISCWRWRILVRVG